LIAGKLTTPTSNKGASCERCGSLLATLKKPAKAVSANAVKAALTKSARTCRKWQHHQQQQQQHEVVSKQCPKQGRGSLVA
jgi:ribosomal protein S27AE